MTGLLVLEQEKIDESGGVGEASPQKSIQKTCHVCVPMKILTGDVPSLQINSTTAHFCDDNCKSIYLSGRK